MSRQKNEDRFISRRSLLKTLGLAPLILRPSAFHGSVLFPGAPPPTLAPLENPDRAFAFSDVRLVPHYPAESPLENVLRLVAPGSDEYVTEKYAFEIEATLARWAESLRASPENLAHFASDLDMSIEASQLIPSKQTELRSAHGVECSRRTFGGKLVAGSQRFVEQLRDWLGPVLQMDTVEFQITGIEEISTAPIAMRLDIRYDLVAQRDASQREERIGYWRTEWLRDAAGLWKARRWEATEEIVSVMRGRAFVDVTSQMLAHVESYKQQMLRGSDYWRTVLDGACGIDVYGNNGIAAGDFDNDGFDDLYVCQPSGLPNRLYRNRGDGTMEDVTEKAGVGVLDGTACALFADFQNRGRQDLLVVCGSGPLLFMNEGDGTFTLKRDAFRFEVPPQGTFTHAALADYDRDGRLDVYFCLYSYYLGLDQYHYPVPYFDARNGPANFLFHNEGDGTFTDRTKAAGLNAENDRYSFACAWGHAGPGSAPDLYVANDFGRSNLYRNNGDGTFTAVSDDAHVSDAGAGMSAAWSDCDNTGKQDIYAANMWSAAGQRVSSQNLFQPNATTDIRALYQRHARGNSLYRNQGDGTFSNASAQAGVEMGRWSWCSDFWDFDHDGYADLYVANGYISAADRGDLSSFFWRQVVGKSPEDSTPSLAYERGWNALNELIRSDRTWNGYERNVMFANNHDGTFSEVSGAVGLDFPEDSRSFVLADLNHDGRLEVVLKNRNAPQLRVLHNAMEALGSSIAFRLKGTKSNHDAIGTAITIEAGSLRQTRYLQAGSGFLAQHSKEVFFGLGKAEGAVDASVQWPSGLAQKFTGIPVNHRVALIEGSTTYAAEPFAAPSAAWGSTGGASKIGPLPSQVETWLIQPLKAPEFSLLDFKGTVHELKSLRGQSVLLTFWMASAPGCEEQLRLLELRREALAARQVAIVTIHIHQAVDDTAELEKAKAIATKTRLGFPVLLATQDIAGVYNIIYRYLFDRRRDLPIPVSFLMDKDGMIVKLYQGMVEPQRVLEDVRGMPTTSAERTRKALPFPGVRYGDALQRNDFTYGVALFQHGYLDQAAESFAQVITAKPNDPEAYYNLGTLHLRRNDFAQAKTYLQQTLKLRPNYPEAWNNLGMIAAQEGHVDEALQNFQQSLLLRPGYTTALENMGNVYRRQKSFDKAQDYLKQALAIQSDDPEIHYSLGMLYAQQGQMQPAAEYLQRAIALRPDYPEARNNLGVLLVREQDYAKAEEQFRTCIQLAPKFDQSYLNLARLFALRGDKAQAREALQKLLAFEPENATARQALGMLQ